MYCRFGRISIFLIETSEYVSEGGNEGGRKATSTSTFIFDFYGIKALLFEFGNDIFNGFKMPRL